MGSHLKKLDMAAPTNDCLCCDSLKITSILAKIELFLWIILFVVNFVIQKDLKDPIWLAGSISIFIFLIVFANSALIYYISLGYHIDLQQSSSILESMENNQVTYLSIGVPILLYNVLKACLLFKSAHKVK